MVTSDTVLLHFLSPSRGRGLGPQPRHIRRKLASVPYLEGFTNVNTQIAGNDGFSEAKKGLRGTPWPWLIVAAVVVVGLVVKAWPHHHPADHSAAIQQSIGASSCDNSGYYLQSKIDGSKQIIYDCQMASGNWKCVTEDGGLASDSTAEVKLLFTNTLSGGKPYCVS